jgi:cyanophycinase
MAKGHERGFGFIPNSAIDQHVSAPHREHQMEPVVAAHPELLGIRIDPNPVVVVKGDPFEVTEIGNVPIDRGPLTPIFNCGSGPLRPLNA